MKVTLKQLYLFVNISKYNSVSKAAEACCITQAAASLSLSQLENSLNTSLFDRVGRRLHLNTHGEELLIKAVSIVDQAEAFEKYATGNTSCISGTIKIGASTTIANYILPKYIAKFRSPYPHVNFEITIANTETIIKKTECLDLDFGLIEGFCDKQNIIQTQWTEDSLNIICSKEHRLAKKRYVSTQDLLDCTWAIREKGSGCRDVFEKSLQLKKPLKSEVTLASSEAIVTYVSHSQCLGYVSSTVLKNNKHDNTIQILKIKNTQFKRDFYKIIHNKKHQTQQSKIFQSQI